MRKNIQGSPEPWNEYSAIDSVNGRAPLFDAAFLAHVDALVGLDGHEHVWGPVEEARFTGNPHRKCTHPGCKVVSLDLDDDE